MLFLCQSVFNYTITMLLSMPIAWWNKVLISTQCKKNLPKTLDVH